MSVKKQFQSIRNLQTNSTNNIQFDIAQILRDAVGAQLWKDKRGLWTAISGACNEYSRDIFDKIQNLTRNLIDIDCCDIHALKSIAASVNASYLTDFINEDYPKDLLKLINLFSVKQQIIIDSFISNYAKADILGTLDNRNKDIFKQTKYSKVLFYTILQNLDNIRYLLQIQNNIDFNFSICSYIPSNMDNNIQYASFSSFIQNNGINFQKYTAPSLNKIFNELNYIKNQFEKKYNLQKENIISSQNTVKTKYTLTYRQTFKQKYLGNISNIQITKDFIISKCLCVNKCNTFNYIKCDKNAANDIIFGWNPYPTDIINNITSYKLYNNLNLSHDILFLNPFLALIAVLKNIIYDQKTGKRLKLFYNDIKTNIDIDLSYIILNSIQTIQTDTLQFYKQMAVFHFYGLFYDMLINDYLKDEWNIYLQNNEINAKYIGKYSQYSKEQFLNRIPKYVNNQALVQFIENGPTYYNQYHLDFIIYLSIINNNIHDLNQDKFDYIITEYNNDFSNTDLKDQIYNQQKRRLLGLVVDYKYYKKISEIQITNSNTYLDINSSIIYYVAQKFANYCNKIKMARQSIKQIIQRYARIGTTQVIQNIIKQYFYKEFTTHSKINDKPYQLVFSDKNRSLDVQLIEYYDTTNYFNIQTTLPDKIVGYIDGQVLTSIIETSGSTPSTYYTTYILQNDVISSNAGLKEIISDNSNTNIIQSKLDFDQLISASRPLETYCPQIAAVSTYSITYNGINKTEYCNCVFYNTNGYSHELSSNWTMSILPPKTSLINSTILEDHGNLAFVSANFQILNNNLVLSSIYQPDSEEYKNLIEQLNINESTESINLSNIIEIKDSIIIPSGSLVKKLRNDVLTYNYHTIVSTDIQKVPVYSANVPTGFYNNKFWNHDGYTNNVKDVFNTQITFWEKYFPELKNASTEINKYTIYQKKIYPFLSSIMEMHAVSGFSGQLSCMQKQYAGDQSGIKRTKNITNTIFPTIASLPNIANLIQKTDISSENNLYINLYLNSFFTNIEKESQNILQTLFNSTQSTNNLFGYPASAWYYCYTSFTGYNSVYSQTTNISQHAVSADKHIDVNGPWIYDILSHFVKQYYKNIIVFQQISKQKFNNLTDPLKLTDPIYLSGIPLNYIKQKIYFISYNEIKNFITNNCKFINQQQKKQKQYLRLFFYQKNIIDKSKYSIYNYKEDIYGNALTLFKSSQYNKFEDCGQIWIRQKNSAFSYPVMWLRQIAEQQDYDTDIFDIIKLSKHNRYANIIKQLTNNALDFGVCDNKIWILGRTNYIKQNNKLVKHNSTQLTICVFEYNYNAIEHSYFINLNSLKFISLDRKNSYLSNINNFVCSYNNYKDKTIDFILYDISSVNKILSDKYKQIIKQLQTQDRDAVINQNLRLDDINLSLIKFSYSLQTLDLYDDSIIMKHVKYPICGLFNSKQLVNNPKHKFNKNTDIQDYTKNINFVFDLITSRSDIYSTQISLFIASVMVNQTQIAEQLSNNIWTYTDISGYIQNNSNIIIHQISSNEYPRYQFSDKINLYIRFNQQFISQIKKIYDSDKHILYNIVTLTDDKKVFFDNLVQFFNIQQTYFQQDKKYHTIQDFIGYNIQIYKKKAIDDILVYNTILPLQMIAQATINYNVEYNSIDIIFQPITRTLDKQIHKNCSIQKRNIVSYYNGENIQFSGKIIVTDLQSQFFKLQHTNSDYIFKFVPFYDCQCNILDITYYNTSSNDQISKNVYDSNLTKEEKRYISGLIMADSQIYYNYNNIYIKQLAINENITEQNYLNYQVFTYNSDIHVYFQFKFNQNLLGKLYYKAFYIDKNTNEIKCKTLGQRLYVHRPDCHNKQTEVLDQHIWKANLNKNTLYIGYQSINTAIQNIALFYKNLYFNQLDQICIDTITFQASTIKKQIGENLFTTVVEDIKFYYGYDIIELPFTFRQLSALIIPQQSYTYVDGLLTFQHQPQNLQFVLNYGNQLNTIHNKYPKYEVSDNKIKCTTILTKLGGIKDFSKDISTNKNQLQFLINYILYSSYKKKQQLIDTTITKDIFEQIVESSDQYCINDFLFNINRIKTLNNKAYFDYDLQAGFSDIIKQLTKENLLNAKNRLVIGKTDLQTYLKKSQTYQTLSSTMPSNDYLITAAAQKNNPLDLLNAGFIYKFYIDQKEYINGTEKQQLYLAYIRAMPAFSQSFNENLKINVNFGQIDSEIKQFIAGTQSFDLDIACYIDDKDINGTQHLKKVGWNCGYLKTEYIDWLTGDNRYGGPQILQCNMSKYNNNLYFQYVSGQEAKRPRYKQQTYNSIAKNIKLHLDVCWYNQSIIISLKPYVDIYWKGLFKRVIVDRTKLSYNKKCCENSWGYDIFLDLRNMMIQYKEDNNLYPVLTTQIKISKVYNIYQNSTNKILCQQAIKEQYKFTNTNIFELDTIFNNYKNYNISILQLIKFYHSFSQVENNLSNIINQFNKLITAASDSIIVSYIAHSSLNYRRTNTIECNKITLFNAIKNDIQYITSDIPSNIGAEQTYYNVIKTIITNPDNSVNIDKCNLLLNKFVNYNNIEQMKEYILHMYEFFNTRISLQQIYLKYNNLLTGVLLRIEEYEYHKPDIFYYYFTNINIEDQLSRIKSKFYYPNLSMPLSGNQQIIGALHEIKNEESLLDQNTKLINLSNTSGFIIFLEYNEDKISRSVIVTDIKKLLNTSNNFLMTIQNYQSINQALQLYLEEVLLVDTTSGLVNLYNSNYMIYNYIPNINNIITPCIRYFIKCGSIDLSQFKYDNIELYKNTGFIFDYNSVYNNIKYNVMTNNVQIKYNTSFDKFILQSSDNNFEMLLESNFAMESQTLYGVHSQITNELIPSQNISYNIDDYIQLNGTIYNYNNQSFDKLSAIVKLDQYSCLNGHLHYISSYIIEDPVNTAFSINVPSGLYKINVYTDSIKYNLVCNTDRYQICSGQPITCKLNLSEYAYPQITRLQPDIGYNFDLYKLNKQQKFETIDLVDCKINNNKIGSSKMSYTTASSIINDRKEYFNQIENSNLGDIELKVELPTKQNIGILKLNITPFYKLKYTTYNLDNHEIIISNYYNLFSTSLSGDNIDQDKKYSISSNIIPLVATSLNNQRIYYNINSLITNKEAFEINGDSKLSFEIDNPYIYPLVYKKMESNGVTDYNQIYNIGDTVISGYSVKNDNFTYQISAYYNTLETAYYIGLISGYYFYKEIMVTNTYKDDKTEFIITPKMTTNQISTEILENNIISSTIYIPSSENVWININNKPYCDIDFMDIDLANAKIQLNKKAY